MEDSGFDRFARQAELVPRTRILEEAAVIVGVGAIGRQVALQLAALGVPRLKLVDFDTVEPTNITTQGYLTCDVGRSKVEATADSAQQIEHMLDVESFQDRFRPRYAVGTSYFCCVDSIGVRTTIWRTVEQRMRFWADGRMLGESMRVLAATTSRGRKHYAGTLFPQAEAQAGACTSRSTIYTANMAAALMVHQFCRYLREMPIDPDATFNLLAGEYVVAEVNE